MARYSIDGGILEDIADAINAKTGETAAMAPGDMAGKIAEIPGGGGVTVEPLSVTENGTYPAPAGKAFSPVTVDVSEISGVTISEITIVSEVDLSANILAVVLPDYADYVGSVVFVSLKDKPETDWVLNQLVSANIAITDAVNSTNNEVCGMRYKGSKPQVFQSNQYQTFMMPGDKFTVMEVPVWTTS